MPNQLSVLCFCLVLCISSSVILNRINPTGPSIEGQVAGIIISFHQGLSYDKLFSTVKQQSKEGSVVLTYFANSNSQKALLEALNGKYNNTDVSLREFVGEVKKLTLQCPNCILFNWECSSGYSDQSFEESGKYVFGLLQLVVKRGYMAMFSDFSLKALIKEWNSYILGPNPFVKVGQTNTAVKLKFDKWQLLRCPSSQLQTVGKLSQNDELTVKVLGGTIMYGVNQRRQKTDKYELFVLTIAENLPAPEAHLQSQINGVKGLAGHVLLSYKEGGKILTSMGHWIELMKIDTSFERLYSASQDLYGQAQAKQMMKEFGDLESQAEKDEYIAKKSHKYIQNQHPGKNKIYSQSQRESASTVDL